MIQRVAVALAAMVALTAVPAGALETTDSADQVLLLHRADHALLIGTAFDASANDVRLLHEADLGYGLIFKLYLLSAATGTPIGDLLSAIGDDDAEGAMGLGRLLKDLDPEVRVAFPKNFGQLNKAARAGRGQGQDGPGLEPADARPIKPGRGRPEAKPGHAGPKPKPDKPGHLGVDGDADDASSPTDHGDRREISG